MAMNPYQSPASASVPKAKTDQPVVTDWFSLIALLTGTVPAVAVSIAIIESDFDNGKLL
jgi:hypothetical protein